MHGVDSLPPIPDQAVSWRLDQAGGLDLMRVTYRTHTFPRHFHETYVVEVVETGVDAFSCGDRSYQAGPTNLVLINPGEVHTGRAAGGGPLSYRSFYPRPQYLADVVRGLGGGGAAPLFPNCVVVDPALATRLRRLHVALEQPLTTLEIESRLLDAFAALLTRQGYGLAPHEGGREDATVRRVCEYLNAHLADRPSLADLAAVARRSPFHLLRVFRRSLGFPPHEYLVNLRVERAKHLLRCRVPLAEVALRTGFSDQSHLTRCFKRRVGLTPAGYARRKIVQDDRG